MWISNEFGLSIWRAFKITEKYAFKENFRLNKGQELKSVDAKTLEKEQMAALGKILFRFPEMIECSTG